MTSVPRSAAEDNRFNELLEAASLLLENGEHLDAVRLLHSEIVHSISDLGAVGLPDKYSSSADARLTHTRLLTEWRSRLAVLPGRTSRIRDLWRSRHAWPSRVVVVVALVGLTLRYAWAVSDKTKWSTQHLEGNWISRYYTNPGFEGFPLVRYDAGVNYDFKSGAPAKEMSKDHFSARWDTCMIVARDVTVALRLVSDDGSKLLLDGVTQVEVGPGPGEKAVDVLLRHGLRHLSVEFVEDEGTALIRLEGLELAGDESYRFQRPMLDGANVRCN